MALSYAAFKRVFQKGGWPDKGISVDGWYGPLTDATDPDRSCAMEGRGGVWRMPKPDAAFSNDVTCPSMEQCKKTT